MWTSIKEEFTLLPKSKIKAGDGIADGRYPFYTSSDIKVSSLNSYQIDDEAVILGTGGKPSCNYACGKFSYSTDNYALKTKGNIKPKFLYYFLRKDGLDILQRGFHGAGLQHIGKDYILGIEIPKCELSAQKDIVATLDHINDLIDNLGERLALFDELIKSRFIEMFGDPDLSEQLTSWKLVSDFAEVLTGTTPSTQDEKNWDGDILWVTPAEIKKDAFWLFDTERKITEKGRKSKSLQLMPKGTVLLSTRAPIGKVAIVGKEMTCNQGFKNFNCDGTVNPIYLYFLLKYNESYLNSIGSGTTFREVSKSKIEKLRMPIPNKDKQNEFASFVEQIDKLRFIVQQQIKELQELLNKKMDEYFGD